MNNLTVVIGTYDRPEFLRGALDSLSDQTVTDFDTLVIDNKVDKEIEEIVESYQSKLKSILYLAEKELGSSQSRNRGFKNAKTEYVACIDDDAKAEETWVENILKVINTEKPDIFGGPIYPYYLDKKPTWFKDSYETRTFGDTARQLKENEFLSGSNIVIKRKLITELNGFRTDLGMKGNKLGYGEETDFQLRTKILNSELEIRYYPDLKVFHYVNPKKMTLKYRFQNLYKSTQSTAKISKKANPISKYLKAIKVVFKLLTGLLFRDRSEYPYYENYVMEEVLNYKR